MTTAITSEPTTRRGAGARMLTATFATLGLDTWSFTGKTVLITGGSRGLGLVLARMLTKQRARVAIIARDEAELDRAKADLRKRAEDVMVLRADVKKPEDAERVVRAVSAELGPIDVLINNAGIIGFGPMELMLSQDYEEAMETHFFGPLRFTLAVLPKMRERGQGRIINISSIGGKVPIPHLLPYSASKFALTGLSQGMRAELLKEGIVVTTVCPGLLRTGSVYNSYFKGRHRAEFAWVNMMASSPLTSMGAERAARQILRASRMGRAEVVLSIQSKIAAKMHGLFPGAMTDIAGLLGRFLPGPGGIGSDRARGLESQSWLSSSLLTILSYRAARKNNELP